MCSKIEKMNTFVIHKKLQSIDIKIHDIRKHVRFDTEKKLPKCMMVDGRPDTDIAGATALGMKTALVRTGRFLPGSSLPDN